MISKALRQRDLYHNPDPLGQLVGEANESKVIVEGQESKALLDSGSLLSAISWTWVKKLKLEPKQLSQSQLWHPLKLLFNIFLFIILVCLVC